MPLRNEFPRMAKVPRRKTRDWRQSFRFVPETVKTKAESLSGDIQLGAVKSVGLSEIERGDYRHLKVEIDQSGRIQVPDDLVLPPKEMGKWSERNIEGWEEKLEHKPKEEFINIIESPNWGDWSRGSHFVEMRGLRYPRKIHNPRLCRFRIELLGQEGESVFKILFLIEEPFASEDAELNNWLFEVGNLLQENTGACDVFSAQASRKSYLEAQHLSWTILPPGEENEVVKLVRVESSGSTPKINIEERMDLLQVCGAKNWLVGTDGFSRYFGAQFAEEVVVFENTRYGNAMYVMGKGWKENSRLSRLELLGAPDADYTRIPHRGNWSLRLQAELRRRLARK